MTAPAVAKNQSDSLNQILLSKGHVMSENFDASKGKIFTVKLPGGDTGVLWSHPSLGEWHRLIATFPNETRAKIYANKETALLEYAAPDLRERIPDNAEEHYQEASVKFTAEDRKWLREQLPTVFGGTKEPDTDDDDLGGHTPATPARAREDADVVAQMVADLPELFEANPEGIPVETIQELYEIDYNTAQRLMGKVELKGLGRWGWQGAVGKGERRFKAPGAVQSRDTREPLTEIRSRVLQAMQQHAEDDGMVWATAKVISDTAGPSVKLGCMSYHLRSLENMGYIVKVHGDRRRPVYRIVQTEK